MGGALVFLALSSIQTAMAQDAVTMTAKHEKAAVVKFKMSIKASVMGADVLLTMVRKTTVKEIKDNGDAVIEQVSEDGKLTIDGKDMDNPGFPLMTLTTSKLNRVTAFDMSKEGQQIMAPEVQHLLAMMNTIQFANKAVKPGDTWDTDLDNPVKKDKKFTVTTAFVGMERVDGISAWKLTQKAEAPADADGNKLVSNFTSWLNPVDGETIKLEGKVKDLPTQFGPLSQEVTMTVINGDKPAEGIALTIKRVYKADDIMQLNTSIKLKIQGADVVITSTSKQVVKEVRKGGSVVLVETDDGGKITVGGQDMPKPPDPPTTITLDQYGKLLDYKTGDTVQGLTLDINRLISATSDVQFPKKAVKAGDSWETIVDNPVIKEKKITVKTTFVGVEKLDGEDVWKLTQSFAAVVKADASKLNADFTYWLNPKDGQMKKVSGKATGIPTDTAGLVDAEITQTVETSPK